MDTPGCTTVTADAARAWSRPWPFRSPGTACPPAPVPRRAPRAGPARSTRGLGAQPGALVRRRPPTCQEAGRPNVASRKGVPTFTRSRGIGPVAGLAAYAAPGDVGLSAGFLRCAQDGVPGARRIARRPCGARSGRWRTRPLQPAGCSPQLRSCTHAVAVPLLAPRLRAWVSPSLVIGPDLPRQPTGSPRRYEDKWAARGTVGTRR